MNPEVKRAVLSRLSEMFTPKGQTPRVYEHSKGYSSALFPCSVNNCIWKSTRHRHIIRVK